MVSVVTGHRDGAVGSAGVLRDLWCLREHDVVQHGVSFFANQLARRRTYIEPVADPRQLPLHGGAATDWCA